MKSYNARQTMSYRAISVSATSQEVAIATGMDGKEYMLITNTGSQIAYIGDSTVTASAGHPIFPKGSYDFGQVTRNFKFHVISTAGTTIGVFEM
jgi:hypothetical protein